MAKHAHSPQELSDPLLPQLPAIPPRLSPSHADSDSAPSSLSASALPVTPPPLLMPTAEVDETGGKTRPIGILHFAAVSFFLVAGGPFGNEYCVIYGGPLLTLVGFVLMPLMWSVPQALMTAELSTALPDNGGYVLWAQYVFGDFVGFVAGANGLLSSLVDSTLYPTLLATYVLALVRGGAFVPSNSSATDMVGALPDGLFEAAAVENFTTSAPAPPSPGNPIDWVSTGIALACVAVGFVINITGVQMVSIVSMICVLIIILPFIVYLCAMAPEIFASNQTYANFTDIPVFQLLPWPDVQWGAFFSTLIWSFTGYDTVGCIAGEVNAAQRTFILGSLVTIFLVILTYAVPIVSMLMVHPNLTTWEDGALLTFLGDVGTWLSVWGCAAAAVQNMGCYYAELTANAHAMWALAARDMPGSQMPVRHLPAFIGRLWRGVPISAVAIHSSFVAIIVLLPVGFDLIVQADMLCSALRLVIEFSSFLVLKFRHPELHRPFAVPWGSCGAVLISVPKLVVLGLLFATADPLSWIFVAVANGLFFIGFAAVKHLSCCGSPYRGRPWAALPLKASTVGRDEESQP